MKVLVTGGSGFIGSHTVVELCAAGHEPVVVDSFVNSEKWIPDRVEQIVGKRPMLYVGDCTDRAFMSDVFLKEQNIEAVIHFAALKAVGESVLKPLLYYKNNLGALKTLLDVMAEHRVSNLVFSSSATVYGEPDANPIPETAVRKQASSPYGNTKIMCEDIIRDIARSNSGFKSVALRYFNPIGAHHSGRIGELPLGVPNNLVPFIMQTAAGIRPSLTLFGNDYNTRDGTCVRDFIHVVDLAKAHISALNYLVRFESPSYDIFNVGTGKGVSVLELVKKFEQISGKPLAYSIGSRREGDIESCYADVEKIKKVLGWSAEKSMEDALEDAWRWQRSLGL
jgi:UDP-glucose 4-epimerase